MTLRREQVEKIAHLARLDLSPDELETMTVQLGRIVDLVDELSGVKTEGVEPLVHAIELSNVMADDEISPSLDRAAALAGAPSADREFFLVPPVF
jgi:aspartyl-tRNA(Asn)/glutamyl-tRNA(Gln) amidotransferase subunit C